MAYPKINLSLILVQLSDTAKNRDISNLTNLGHLLIKVKPQKVRTSIHNVTDTRNMATIRRIATAPQNA